MSEIGGPEREGRKLPDEETQRRDQVRQQAWAELGLPAPRFEDERNAPPVDMTLIRRVLSDPQSVAEEDRMRLADLVLRFRSWGDAVCSEMDRLRDERDRMQSD